MYIENPSEIISHVADDPPEDPCCNILIGVTALMLGGKVKPMAVLSPALDEERVASG
jgi:hypothetical protein